ncbi:hypothetical protein C8R43DRAFT_1175202 [Mycena crocata]|nr:hypothetical protein C8R43DRAFT_1175202 [Mycena crocata]
MPARHNILSLLSSTTITVRLPGKNSSFLIYSLMSLIQSLPSETLCEIFEWLDFPSAALAALTCRQWHGAATGNSKLWTVIGITARDIERPEVLERVLARSKDRPISLGFRFESTMAEPLNCAGLYPLLCSVIRKHLHRCERLFVYAEQVAWPLVLNAFEGEGFPALRVLYLRNEDALAQWQLDQAGSSSLNETDPIPDLSAPVPPSHFVFPLPHGHLLFEAALQGVSLGDATLPNLKYLRVGHEFPGIVVDGVLNPWLFADTDELTIEGICVPALSYPTPIEKHSRYPPGPEHMALRELSSMPRDTPDEDGYYEHDCRPFFTSLNTSCLRTLIIDAFDLESRVWDDFILSLTIDGRPKYPFVEEMQLRQMDFADMSYTHVAFFMCAFPSLQRLQMVDCFDGTWQDVVNVLEMFPAMCVKLKQLEFDDAVIVRDDPIPFREPMFLPFEDDELDF